MSFAKQLYDAYNAGGDPETANKNYCGEPCPAWEDLPENIRAKWEAVAVHKREMEALHRGADLYFGYAVMLMQNGHALRPKGGVIYYTLENGNFYANGRGVKMIVNIDTRLILGWWEIVSPEEKAIMDSPTT